MIINNTFINVNEYFAKNNVHDATIIITHGLAEYSKYYDEIAKYLQTNDFNVITYDLKGHGKSFGKRGSINSYKEYLKDLSELVSYAKKKTKKVYLIGHSLGGVITNLYVLKYGNVDGVIISSSPTFYLPAIEKIKYFPFKYFLRNKKMYTNFKDSRLLNNNNYVKDVYDLEYYYFNIGHEVLYKGIKYLNKNFDKYLTPVLFIHSKSDELVDYKHSENIYKKISSKDKNIILLDKSYHNIFNDIEKELVYKNILDWLVERV